MNYFFAESLGWPDAFVVVAGIVAVVTLVLALPSLLRRGRGEG